MSVSEMHNNVYLVTCTTTGEQLLNDSPPTTPTAACCSSARAAGRLDHLVTTHQHWDRVPALEDVTRSTGATEGCRGGRR